MLTMNVTVYTMHGCSACDRAREFLSRNGVKFDERNVSEDSKAREELLAMGFRAAPVIKVDSQTMLGFDPEKLKQFLGLKG
jgi:glutaredoxin 3